MVVAIRRAKTDIAADILNIADKSEGVNKTHIIYNANLNFPIFEKYMKILLEKGLVETGIIKGTPSCRAYFRTTEKGRDFLKRYEDIRGIIQHEQKEEA